MNWPQMISQENCLQKNSSYAGIAMRNAELEHCAKCGRIRLCKVATIKIISNRKYGPNSAKTPDQLDFAFTFFSHSFGQKRGLYLGKKRY